MIRKTSALDPDAEELTPEGEAAFLEGLASAGGYSPGDMVRLSAGNLPGEHKGNEPSQHDATWDRSEVFKDVVKNIPWYTYPALYFAKNPLLTGSLIDVAAGRILENEVRKIHYSRNKYNTPLPETIDEAKTWGWGIEEADYCHQFGVPAGGTRNVKYIPSKDGREQIFTHDGKVDNSPENIGTYNFFNPQESLALHGAFDFVPWVRFGNTPDDTTTIPQRIWRSLDLG